jgi:hypothetical protein
VVYSMTMIMLREFGGECLPPSTNCWKSRSSNRIMQQQAIAPDQRSILYQLRDGQQRMEGKMDQLVSFVQGRPVDPTIEAVTARRSSPIRLVHKPKKHTQIITHGIPCRLVFFLGGGKSGSTTIASWLKHDATSNYTLYSPNSQFLDGPKEICVGRKKSIAADLLAELDPQPASLQSCPVDRPYILDGCPSLVDPVKYRHLHNLLDRATATTAAKFIVIVRDPVDRLVSHYNDNRPPKLIRDIDAKIMNVAVVAVHHGKSNNNHTKSNSTNNGSNLRENLSLVGTLLANAIAEFGASNIMVVVNEIMKSHGQDVLDDIMDFLDLPRRKLQINAPPLNAQRPDFYSRPSPTAVAMTQRRFFNDTEYFMEQLGVSVLPWNIVYARQNVTSDRELYQKVYGGQDGAAAIIAAKPKLRVAAYQQYMESLREQPPPNDNETDEEDRVETAYV